MKKLLYGFIFSLMLFSYADAQIATDQIYGGVYTKAETENKIADGVDEATALIVTSFDGFLTAADDTVQKALDTIDNLKSIIYTKTEVDSTIETAIEAAIVAIPAADLSNYYTKTQTESTVAVMINDNAQAKYWYANNMVSGDFTGEVLIATVASSQTQYYAVYMSSSGLAAADADAYSTLPAIGVILETGTGDKKVLVKGLVRNDSWNWTVGGRVYVSESAGQLTQTAPSTKGKMVNIVGIAVHADILYVCPSTTVVEN